MVATARGSLRVMELLLEHGARLDTRDAFGQTADSFAVVFNKTQSRRTIIQFKWKKRNEASMVREREVKSAKSRAKSESEQAADLAVLKREERLERLAEQREKRHEQLAAQQLRIPKKKRKWKKIHEVRTLFIRMRTDISLSAPPSTSPQRASVVRFADDERDNDSENFDRSLERFSLPDSSHAPMPSSRPPANPSSNQPTQKLFAHQFYDVYAGMTDEEWIKVRNAFVAQHFSE